MSELDIGVQTESKKRENVVAGTVGAFLGTLIGVVCIVLIGQLGYVASISGLIMAVCALKGYELLGGRLGKVGVVISSLLILAMTYLAHQLDWAVSIASALEAGILESFRAIPYLREIGAIESRSYWGGLAMLYLFTLLGAVPTVISGLRGDSLPDLPPVSSQAPEAGQGMELTLYPPHPGWTKPLRVSASLSMFLVLVPGLVLILFWSAMGGGAPMWYLMAALGCIGSSFVMLFVTMNPLQLCQAEYQVLARSDGTVWQIQLSALNLMDTYRFTKKNAILRALRWDRLNPEDQTRARASIARAIGLLQSGQVMSGSALSRTVHPLTDLQVEDEDNWCWKTTYSVNNGKRKKLSIAKAYPDFAPAPGMAPPSGPMPFRWNFLVIAAVVAAALGAVAAVGLGGLI